MRVDFYHLAETPLERVLPSICEKTLAQGQRLLIVAGSTRLDAIDRFLWTEVPASFLPHGREGAEQPILLSPEVDPANGASNVALADGIWRDEALAFERAFYFFDAVTIDEARAAWRALKGREGIEARYWKRSEGGRWVEGP